MNYNNELRNFKNIVTEKNDEICLKKTDREYLKSILDLCTNIL